MEARRGPAGQAPESLLDSYERERRPIAAFYTAHSLENAGRHAPVGAALGLGPGLSDDEGWGEVAVFTSDTPQGEARRAAVAAAVADNALDYSQLNVEAGFQYPAGAYIPDGPSEFGDDSSPIDYHPSTKPGRHLPHVWLRDTAGATSKDPVSTIDLVETTSLTLFVGPSAQGAWASAAAAQQWPVSLVVVSDADAEWAAVRGVDEGGAVLVRPDRKVAWRIPTLPADPKFALTEAMGTILSGGFALPEDPAEPYLVRIRHAAGLLVR